MKLLAGENPDLAEHIQECQEHEKTGKRNQLTFMSNNFVNNSLFIIRKFLLRTIVNEINASGGQFGLLMDGSQDISTQEQISLVVRYIDGKNKVVERTIGFFNIAKTSGEALYESVRSKLDEVGLPLDNIVGCSFDGASNMQSEVKGVISFIKMHHNTNCFFSWCLSHRFNLCVKSAFGSSNKIKEVLSLAEECAKIFRSSYKRMNVWVEVITAISGFNSKRRLKMIGKTRWSSNQDAIKSIIKDETSLYAVIKSLLKVCSLDNLDGAALVNASTLLNSWLRYDNVVVAFLLHKVFSTITPTTKFLQKMGLHILIGVRSLKACMKRLEECENKLDDYIQQAIEFVNQTNSKLSNDKEISELDCDCYISLPIEEQKAAKNDRIKAIFRDFIEKLRNAIDERVLSDFDGTESIYRELLLFDPLFAKEIFETDENSVGIPLLCEINKITDQNAAIRELKKFTFEFIQHQNRPESVAVLSNNIYENEFLCFDEGEDELNLIIESDSDAEETQADLNSVKICQINGKKCCCLDCILKYIYSNEERMKTYSIILKIFKYVATLPSTQVKCERDFSKLKLTKTRLRSSLGENMLENLIIISTESGMFKNVDIEDIVDEIVASSTRITSYVG